MLVLFLLVFPGTAFAQDALSVRERDGLVAAIQELVAENYVYPERTEGINRALDERYRSPAYAGVTDQEALGAALTEDLVAVSNDKHFAVVYNPSFIASRRAARERASRQRDHGADQVERADREERIDWNLWHARQDNFGFVRAEILDGNIGYVRFDFFHFLDWARPAIDSAMSFVQNTDALIIDVRNNGGGYSPTDAYIASYFFDEGETVWSSSYNRPLDETSSVSTFAEVGAERYLGRPVFVLVGENSFSLAEKFAYGMKHFGKATIVGQTTSGAAHAVDIMELNDSLFIQMPIVRNIHPVTGTDWEGTGVVPDVPAAAGRAIWVAHLRALDALLEGATVERIRDHYEGIKTELLNASPGG